MQFHDAVIADVSVSVHRRECASRVSLLEEGRGRDRRVALLAVTGMETFFGRFDFEELADHARAGNVQDGGADAASGTLLLHLVGGLMEAVGEGVELRGCPRPKSDPRIRDSAHDLRGLSHIGDDELDFSNVVDIDLSPSTRTCTLSMQLRVTSSSFERSAATLRFEGVTSCLAKINFAEMAGEHRAGNVHSCHIDAGRGRVRMHLRHGFIEIVAGSASLSRV